MIKIIALNDDSKEDPNVEEEHIATREAQETIAESEYVRAIKLKSEGDIQFCLHLLNELLETQVLNENIKNNRDDKLWTIKYNCHKNIAFILEERSEYMLAIQHYISAILIDNTDVSTIYKFGRLALKLNATDLAEYAFENCICLNSAHWCAAEGMLQVMNANHNIVGLYCCAKRIFEQAINHENATKILQEVINLFKDNLIFFKECIGNQKNELFGKKLYKSSNLTQLKYILDGEKTFKKSQQSLVDQPPDLKKFYFEQFGWHSVGQFIACVYVHLNETKHDMIFELMFSDVLINSNVANLYNVTSEPLETIITTNENTKSKNSTDPFCSLIACAVDQHKSSAYEKLYEKSYNNYNSDSFAKSDATDIIKMKPRRRCSDLHFLEQWGWHKNRRCSSRKKTERDDVDSTLNGYLRKMFAKYTNLNIEDKWPFSEITESENNFDTACKECETPLSEDSFNVTTKNLIEQCIKSLKKKPMDLMEMTFKWLKYISLAWFLPIPLKLSILYIDVFEVYVSHYNLSTWNQLTPSNFEASYRICLLYLELGARSNSTCNSVLWRTVFHQLLFNAGNFHLISRENFIIFQIKLIYLEYLVHNKEHRNKECVFCLQQMIDILEQQQPSFTLHSPNLNKVCLNINYIKGLQLKYKREIDVQNIPKLYERGCWEELTNVIISNIESSVNKYDNVEWLKDICAQIQILLQSLWKMTSYENCLIWSEKCFHFAALHFLQESKTSQNSSLSAQLINFTTSYIEAIILNEGFHIVSVLNKELLSRMIQNIIRILVYQFDGTFEKNSNHGQEINSKRLWVILHQLILREENDAAGIITMSTSHVQDPSDLIPKSFLILFTAHEYLGKRQWCTNDNGEFLQYVLDAVVHNLKAPVYDVCRDVIYEYIEQVTYCLFKYPPKKARLRHLEDHEASQISLSWQKSIQLFELYRPEDLPEFNSYKLDSITSDMEQFLLKFMSLMPKDLDPSIAVHHVTMFIAGYCESPPVDANAFKLPYKILSLYYLLADFYFKNRDFPKAIKFYTLDLTANPTRFDSWAGMALSKASKIETTLNCLDPISIDAIWEECEEVLRCFECCINLNRFQTLLWIEYGSFTYIIHSCFSRFIKNSSKYMSVDSFPIINERKTKMLTIAYNCFSLANSLQNSTSCNDNADSNDEKWLCQYMLGKISEKRKEEPKVYLKHYLMAANYLYENSATYPIKLNHSNPTTLSVEALEVFYRINASIIKYLQSGKEITRCTGNLFNKILKSLSNSPFAYNKAKIDGNCLNGLKGKFINNLKSPIITALREDANCFIFDNAVEESEIANNEDNIKLTEDKKVCSNSSADIHGNNSATSSVLSSDASTAESDIDSDECLNYNSTHTSEYSPEELNIVYRMVVQNIEECATRFPEHYKSIYRLVYYYMNSTLQHCDLTKSEQLLLGQYKTSLGNVLNGLFYDRKNNNLFNGIWRIPSSEIDRPGSFSAHLVKCVKIFIQLLYKTDNYNTLVDIAINLYKTPDLDKRYIMDAERLDLCQQSISYAIKVLQYILQKNIDKPGEGKMLNLLIDIYKVHKKCVKYMNQKEPIFAELLVEVYKSFIIGKVDYVPDNSNFLDSAIKLCVQETTAQKNIERSVCIDNTITKSDCITSHSAVESTVSNSGDTIQLKTLFEEFYSKMLQNKLYHQRPLALIQQNSITQLEDQTTSHVFLNSSTQKTPSSSSNVKESCSTSSDDAVLQNQSCFLNPKGLPKSLNKKKIVFKPYNRSNRCANSLKYLPNNYAIDLFDSNTNALTAYSRLLNNTTSAQILFNQKFMKANTNNSKVNVQNRTNSNAVTNIPSKDVQVDATSLKLLKPCASPPNSLSVIHLQNPDSYEQSTSLFSGTIPTKSLQEKLAERQKPYQLNEAISAEEKSIDDIIVLE